jgi:hypothetical protein
VTSRRRPLGRLLVDSAGDTGALLESVQSTVAEVAETVADPEASPLSLWLVNSLGGGTGSGAFPLLALLLAESARAYPGSVDLFGAGSLPRLDELDKRLGRPGGEPVHYANAYTALRELRTLMDLDGETPYPLEVTLDASPRGIRADAATIEENPFDAYWLLGIEEDDRFDPDYYQRMNEIVAHLVLYVSALDSRDWFSTGRLYSVTGLPITLPTDRVREFRRLDAAIEDGFVQFLPCVADPAQGALGIVYANLGRVDGTLDVEEPEVLFYEPQKNGRLRLIGVEMVVPIALWTGSETPSLFGHEFHRNDALGLYGIHIWVWRHSPAGVFAFMHPRASCLFAG